MEEYRGYLFAKLDALTSKSEGPQYFLQQWDAHGEHTWDTHIRKQTDMLHEVDPKLHPFIAQKVTILGTIEEDTKYRKSIVYKEIRKGIKQP